MTTELDVFICRPLNQLLMGDDQILNGVYRDDENIRVVIEAGQSKAMDAHGMRSLFSTLPEVIIFRKIRKKQL